jgi:hypothetical protein
VTTYLVSLDTDSEGRSTTTQTNAGADFEGEPPEDVAEDFPFESGFVERSNPFSSRTWGANPGLSSDWPKNPGAGAGIVLA